MYGYRCTHSARSANELIVDIHSYRIPQFQCLQSVLARHSALVRSTLCRIVAPVGPTHLISAGLNV
jgi:hypothetical protein